MEKYADQKFDFIITVCDHAKENCPYFPGDALRLHHNFTDPANASGSEEDILNVYRRVRDEIKTYSQRFIEEYY
jgi:arsenate reductase